MLTPPDLEAWLCSYIRSSIPDIEVDNKEPWKYSLPLVKPLVVVRDDSGSRMSHVTFDRSVGVSVIAGTKRRDKQANDLARQIEALLTDDHIVFAEGSPIASVTWDGCFGPYAVADDLDVARRYMTVQYTVVGAW